MKKRKPVQLVTNVPPRFTGYYAYRHHFDDTWEPFFFSKSSKSESKDWDRYNVCILFGIKPEYDFYTRFRLKRDRKTNSLRFVFFSRRTTKGLKKSYIFDKSKNPYLEGIR
jgi:hypothetical protein